MGGRLLLAALTALLTIAAAPASAAIKIDVLSNRADLVSGGDALVAVGLPAGADVSALKVAVGGRDVTSAFARRGDGSVSGVISGLSDGKNVVSARLGSDSATLAIRNHPSTGPIMAGPQIRPWICLPDTKGDQCQTDTTVTWAYKPAGSGAFDAYDPDAPPPDGSIATTTTDTGETVPFIVRIEKGSMDRAEYAIAVLADPAKPWSRWEPYKGWNHKVMWPFGGGSNPDYSEHKAQNVLDENALSRGFMVALNSLNVHGNNSNDNVSAEALMMLREHIVEAYGDIRWTIGEGCSGGGLQQYMISSMYPGLIDGLMPSCSFPDFWSEIVEVADCLLLTHYFNGPSAPLWPDPNQQNAVRGKGPHPGCAIWDSTYSSLINPTDHDNFKSCGLPSEQVYDPMTNPKGTRCTIQDYQVAVWGRRASDGFANRPYDNVGVQYGLSLLRTGQITPAQFVDLNTKVGGLDIDAQPVAERSHADPGSLETAYRSSQIADARQWAKVPIIDIRGHSTTEWHQDFNSYQARARLDALYGNHDNQVIWTGEAPIAADPALSCSTSASAPQEAGATTVPPFPSTGCTANPLEAMDRWLTAIHKDTSDAPVERKVARNRPKDVVDACWAGGQRIDDASQCRELYPYYGTSRTVAAGPMAGDILKCTLKPLNRSDYTVKFTDEEWAALQKAFPEGVCDWSKPGVDQQPSTPWMTFAQGPGGRPLGPAPRSCANRGRFTVTVKRVAGKRLRSLRVRVGNRKARVVRRGGAFVVTVDVRRLSAHTVRVRLTGRSAAGKKVVGTRRYKTCR